MSGLLFSFVVGVPACGVAVAVCPLPLGPLRRLVIPCGFLIALVTFASLLPFLILTLTNGFFRERIKPLFQLAAPQPPPALM